jgi:hypothetical protein
VRTVCVMGVMSQPMLLDPPFEFGGNAAHFRPLHRYHRNGGDGDSHEHEWNADDEQGHRRRTFDLGVSRPRSHVFQHDME